MEDFVKQTLLFDFYGELLTRHQQRIYEDVVCNDLSLSEAAEELGVSRQSVHDLIRRCNKQLEEYESRLHLVERFVELRRKVGALRESAASALENGTEPDLKEMVRACDEILKEL